MEHGKTAPRAGGQLQVRLAHEDLLQLLSFRGQFRGRFFVPDLLFLLGRLLC
jgi:hypothetical protein